MKTVIISDTTLKQKESRTLTFRQRLELVKYLDRLGLDVIELPLIVNNREDSLFIKSVSEGVKNARVCVSTVNPSKDEIDNLHSLVEKAKNKRVQISLPISSVQMEYFFHKKAESMLGMIKENVSYAKSFSDWEVELVLRDATRAETSVLKQAVSENLNADVITICDDDVSFLPSDFVSFIKGVLPGGVECSSAGVQSACEASAPCAQRAASAPSVPCVQRVASAPVDPTCSVPRFGVCVTNNLHLADISSIYALEAGVSEIKTQCVSSSFASTENVVRILNTKSGELGCKTGVNTIEISRIMSMINKMYMPETNRRTPFENGVRDEQHNKDRIFTISDTKDAIFKEIHSLGYELSEEELEAVYKMFLETVKKKQKVQIKDLEAIIASSAMQVTPTYNLDYFIINSGNTISATSHIRMRKDGEILEDVSVGDGPVDASFLTIEKITGRHYELDDFQVQTVTEGREAMGEALVKLRANGKVYSGKGVSTDIICSSIMAYVNALNKIEYDNKECSK